MCIQNECNKLKHRRELNRPKRALSAYNIFFRCERSRILRGIEDGSISIYRNEDGTVRIVHQGEDFVSKQKYCLDEVRKKLNTVEVRTTRRPHRKSHGKIGFIELIKYMGKSWSEMNKDSREVFNLLASEEKQKFRKFFSQKNTSTGPVKYQQTKSIAKKSRRKARKCDQVRFSNFSRSSPPSVSIQDVKKHTSYDFLTDVESSLPIITKSEKDDSVIGAQEERNPLNSDYTIDLEVSNSKVQETYVSQYIVNSVNSFGNTSSGSDEESDSECLPNITKPGNHNPFILIEEEFIPLHGDYNTEMEVSTSKVQQTDVPETTVGDINSCCNMSSASDKESDLAEFLSEFDWEKF